MMILMWSDGSESEPRVRCALVLAMGMPIYRGALEGVVLLYVSILHSMRRHFMYDSIDQDATPTNCNYAGYVRHFSMSRRGFVSIGGSLFRF